MTPIRRATVDDLKPIADVHTAAFPGFFLTRLGRPFLRRYYGLVLEYAEGVLLVAADGAGSIRGFVSGFLRRDAFYRHMRASRWRLAPAVLWGLARTPSLLARIVANVTRVKTAGGEAIGHESSPCELSSIAVRPDASGSGIGSELTRAFLAEARTRGIAVVSLTTDADDNESTHRFYRRLGFREVRALRTAPGRKMVEYQFHLEETERNHDEKT